MRPATYANWTSYNNQHGMTSFVQITVDSDNTSGEVFTLEPEDNAVDKFTL